MRRNIIIIVVSLGCLLSGIFAFTKTSSQELPELSIVRYQLIQGVFNVDSNGTVFESKSIFKIDTKTGIVWNYATGLDKNGIYYSKWMLIDN